MDAIALARTCGLRYLWIDALCLIHEAELRKMSDYLQKATVVIIAAASVSMHHGIIQDRPAPLINLGSVSTLSIGADANRPASVRLYLRKPLQSASEALSDRVLKKCWMIQEAILPQSLLIWGETRHTGAVGHFFNRKEVPCPRSHGSNSCPGHRRYPRAPKLRVVFGLGILLSKSTRPGK